MATFSEFNNSLLELVKSYQEKNTHLKIRNDLDSDIIKIFGEKISSLAKAKDGLEDLEELALSTAEHHPYWNLLNHSTQIAKTILEKWNDDLSKEELDEIEWSIEELNNTIKKIKEI